MVLTGAIGYEYYVISRADLGTLGLIFAAGVTSGSLVLLGITAWVYPLCSLSDGQSSLRRTLATATSMTVKHLPRTALAVLALLIVPAAIFFFPGQIYAISTYVFLIGYALSWYLVMLALEPALPAGLD